MTDSFKEKIENMRWSYSRLSSFTMCPYGWYLKYIEGIEEEPQFYTTYGSFVHYLLEQFYSGKATKDELKNRFLTEFSYKVEGKRPKDSTVVKYIKSGMDYFENFKEVPYKVLGIEKEINFEVNGNKFIGFIDLLCEVDGDLIIIDNKSRELKQRSKRKKPTLKDAELDEMLVQLYIYAEGIRQEYGVYPKYLAFNCFRNGEFIIEEFKIEKCEEALLWASRIIKMIKSLSANDFPPYSEFFKCRNLCGVSHECEYLE